MNEEVAPPFAIHTRLSLRGRIHRLRDLPKLFGQYIRPPIKIGMTGFRTVSCTAKNIF
jgi:hypothetical protein